MPQGARGEVLRPLYPVFFHQLEKKSRLDGPVACDRRGGLVLLWG